MCTYSMTWERRLGAFIEILHIELLFPFLRDVGELIHIFVVQVISMGHISRPCLDYAAVLHVGPQQGLLVYAPTSSTVTLYDKSLAGYITKYKGKKRIHYQNV